VRAAVKQVASEPAQRKCRRVGPTEHHCACADQIVDDRAVGLRDTPFLEPASVARGEACLIDIYFHCDRHAAERSRIVSACQLAVDVVGLFSHFVGSEIHNRIDPRIDIVKALESCIGHFTGGDFTRPHKMSDFRRRKTPKFIH
jgi:hypothetical protein